MPNHCENHTNISGPLPDVRACLDAMRGDEEEILLKNLLPMPADLGDRWYSWALDNWGTKWGDYEHWSDDGFDIDEYEDGQGQMWSSYYTAWGSFSESFWRQVSLRFPTLTFTNTYQEESMAFAGAVAVRNGVVSEAYTEELPDYPEPDENGEWDTQDHCDAMCALRDRLLDEAEVGLLEVTA